MDGRMGGCNLCGKTTWKTMEQVNGTRVVRCTCGLVFVTPQPSIPTLQECYDRDYYTPWEQQGRLRAGIWKRRLASVEAVAPPAARLLDVGCGTGTFLQLAAARGWEVTGTEFSGYACAVAHRQGFTVCEGEVWDAKFPDNAFDIITSWHVLEHVGDPRRVLEESFRILRPNGWMFLATPNLHDRFFQLAYRLTRGRRPPLFEPDEREKHLYFFDRQTLRDLVASAQFEVIRVDFDRGAAAVWNKKVIDDLAYLWFRCTGLHWGMALQLQARKTSPWEKLG